MTIREADELSNILGDDAQSARINNWTWHYLVNFQGFPKHLVSKYPDRNAMAKFINQKNIPNIVQNKFKDSLLPDLELQWISDNERQIRWIMAYLGIREIPPSTPEESLPWWNYGKWGIPTLEKPFDPRLEIFTIPGLNLKSLIYLAFDLSDPNLSKKRDILSSMRNDWEIMVERDKIFDFFADDNPEKFKILRLKIQKEFKDKEKPDLKHPSLNHILSSFDLFNFSEMELRSLVEKCRTTYNQKIRRSKPDAKQQCNLLLSKSTILQLEKLARNHGFSRSEVIEILIKNEHKHEIYLKERAELKKRLLLDNQDKSQTFI